MKKNVKISKLISLHTLLSAAAGISLAVVLFVNFQKLESAQHDAINEAIIQKDILRIEEGYRQHLILMDLILGNSQTYLAAGAQRQIELLTDISTNILNIKFSIDFTDDITHFVSLIAVSSSTLSSILAGKEIKSDALSQFDNQADQAIKLLRKIRSTINEQVQQNTNDLAEKRLHVFVQGVLSVIIFMVFIAAQRFWMTRYLVNPMQKLTSAVTKAQQTGQPFEFDDPFSPWEIRELAEQSRIFINELQLKAHYDELTKLPNYALLTDRFHQSVARSARSKTLIALCFLDLDKFKPVNDTYGHDVGDKLLIEVTQRIQSVIREEDTLSRKGGDEFVLLISSLKSCKQCKDLMTRICHQVSQPFFINGHTISISVSIGITIYPLDDVDLETLLRHADKAMYQAKLAGRNNFKLFNSCVEPNET